MTTAATANRLEQRFKLWDIDKDGRIERTDFQAEAERIIKAFGEDADSPRGRTVMDTYLNMYDFLASKAGVGKKGLNLQQFADVVKREMIEQGNSGFARVLRPTIRAIVDLCDVTGDGAINPTEFRRWVDAIGAGSGADADESFRRIDVNGNGTLSVDELVEAIKQYHFGQSDTALLGA